MQESSLRSYLGLILLAAGVLYFRDDPGSTFAYVGSSVLVLVFWYLNHLKLALSNLRLILIFAAFFGVALIVAQFAFGSGEDAAKTGLTLEGSLDPTTITRLKQSHDFALNVYFDHKPTREERYYNSGTLPFSEDGIHYSTNKRSLDPKNFPQTAEWARQNLAAQDLSGDLKKMESWFADSFAYTLSPGKLASPKPLDEFLFTSRKGFCEHYAASATTLLKLRGYKARVVVGYAGGRWNPLFHVLTYEDADAHAWVEVLDPTAKKWRIVDPTGWVVTGVAGIERSSDNKLILFCAFALILVLLAIFFYAPSRSDGRDMLLNKVLALERKQGLETSGLTLTERIARLAPLYPARAAAMQSSLDMYVAAYFAKEPSQIDKSALATYIARWGRR